MIIDSDYNTLTILDKGIIRIRNLNEYNLLKYRDFDGNRIMIKLSDKCNITETFNEGIFNVNYGNISMQIRDYNELSKRVLFSVQNKTDQPIKELLLENKKEEIEKDFLIKVLNQYGKRIKCTDKIIIDDRFAVDANGQAYYIENNKFNRLCVVALSVNELRLIAKHELGDLNIDFKTKEIFCKVLFLLFPDKTDSVFFNQLPDRIKKLI